MPKAQTDKGRFMQGQRPRKRAPLKVGRITKLTPDVSKKICDAVRAGNALSVAARYSGVSEYTLHDWLARGRGEHASRSASPVYVQFVNDVAEAEAAAEVAAVLHWRSAMPKDWHAAKDWLKTTKPDRWDPDKDKIGPIAAVQVNLGPQTGVDAPEVHEMPLSTLIEDSPAFLKAVTPLFDAVDDVYRQNDAESAQTASNDASMDENTPKTPLMLPNGAFNDDNAQNSTESAHDAVFDPEIGSWRVIESQSDENAL